MKPTSAFSSTTSYKRRGRTLPNVYLPRGISHPPPAGRRGHAFDRTLLQARVGYRPSPRPPRRKRASREPLIDFCANYSVKPQYLNAGLEQLGTTPLAHGCKLETLVLRPQLTLENLSALIPALRRRWTKYPSRGTRRLSRRRRFSSSIAGTSSGNSSSRTRLVGSRIYASGASSTITPSRAYRRRARRS